MEQPKRTARAVRPKPETATINRAEITPTTPTDADYDEAEAILRRLAEIGRKLEEILKATEPEDDAELDEIDEVDDPLAQGGA